jgi:hypothetical protein
MTTPQDPARRLKQKRRREKQLARWRDQQPAKDTAAKASPAKASSTKASPAKAKG